MISETALKERINQIMIIEQDFLNKLKARCNELCDNIETIKESDFYVSGVKRALQEYEGIKLVRKSAEADYKADMEYVLHK